MTQPDEPPLNIPANLSVRRRCVAATAVVTLTLKVRVGSNWPYNCELDQVHRQATKEALGMINSINQRPDLRGQFEVVGTPEVTMILVDSQK